MGQRQHGQSHVRPHSRLIIESAALPILWLPPPPLLRNAELFMNAFHHDVDHTTVDRSHGKPVPHRGKCHSYISPKRTHSLLEDFDFGQQGLSSRMVLNFERTMVEQQQCPGRVIKPYCDEYSRMRPTRYDWIQHQRHVRRGAHNQVQNAEAGLGL